MITFHWSLKSEDVIAKLLIALAVSQSFRADHKIGITNVQLQSVLLLPIISFNEIAFGRVPRTSQNQRFRAAGTLKLNVCVCDSRTISSVKTDCWVVVAWLPDDRNCFWPTPQWAPQSNDPAAGSLHHCHATAQQIGTIPWLRSSGDVRNGFTVLISSFSQWPHADRSDGGKDVTFDLF